MSHQYQKLKKDMTYSCSYNTCLHSSLFSLSLSLFLSLPPFLPPLSLLSFLVLQGTPERKPAAVDVGDGSDIKARDSGLHSSGTVASSDSKYSTTPMEMSLDDNDSGVGDGGPLHAQLLRDHRPAPLQLQRDPSTDIPLDPELAESHYFDVDDFEADESESEVSDLIGILVSLPCFSGCLSTFHQHSHFRLTNRKTKILHHSLQIT